MKAEESLHLKVVKKHAEAARKKIIEQDSYDHNHLTIHDETHVFFPITAEISVPSGKLVKIPSKIRPRKPKSLKEAVNGSRDAPISFDIVGDIAILEFDDMFSSDKTRVAKALLDTFSNIHVVVEKSAKVGGKYRVRGITHLAGEKRTETVHKEYGCHYKLDVAEAYFSPRLGTERMRVASQVKEGERVLVLFAGVGPYAILIAKNRAPGEVIAIELNPFACTYMKINIERNRVEVKAKCADAREETTKLGKFDRIIMPLPKDAGDFLDVALPALNPGGVIHFYTFAHDEKEAEAMVNKKSEEIGFKIKVEDIVECGSYSPRLSRYCVDFTLL